MRSAELMNSFSLTGVFISPFLIFDNLISISLREYLLKFSSSKDLELGVKKGFCDTDL